MPVGSNQFQNSPRTRRLPLTDSFGESCVSAIPAHVAGGEEAIRPANASNQGAAARGARHVNGVRLFTETVLLTFANYSHRETSEADPAAGSNRDGPKLPRECAAGETARSGFPRSSPPDRSSS